MKISRKKKWSALLVCACAMGASSYTTAAASVFPGNDIVGPTGSGAFGSVTVLAGGNVVVVDASFGLPGTPRVGAVYLYDGINQALISTVTGSSAFDRWAAAASSN